MFCNISHSCPILHLCQKRMQKRYTPIQTSPNWPLPRRLMSCSDSRGISHTSLVLTDRSVRRGMPLWHGAIRRQHSPAALAGLTVQFDFETISEKYENILCKLNHLYVGHVRKILYSSLTRVVLHQLLQRFKLGPGGDVVSSTVEFTNLIVFDMISLDVIPVLDGEGVGPCHTDTTQR